MPRKPATDNVAALERGFEVLECFAAAQRPLGNGEVAERTGIPRPSVSRLIATLVSLGHLRPARGTDQYELAAGVVRLAQAFLGAIDVRSHARPHVIALAEEAGASAFLGVRDGDEMLVVEAGRSRSAVALLGSDVGTRMSLANSALGRAWLAGVDAATREAVLAPWRHGHGARADGALQAGLREARRDGFALSLGEWHPDINAVAVPVRTAGGEVVSLNCGGPAFLLSAQRLREVVVPRLLRTAEALAHDIGGLAGPQLMADNDHEGAPAAPTADPLPTSARTPRRRNLPTGACP